MMVYGAIRPVGMELSLAYLPVGFAHLCSSFSQIVPKCKMQMEGLLAGLASIFFRF